MYQQELGKLNFDERFPQIMADTLASSADLLLPGVSPNILAALRAIPTQDLMRIILPPNWAQEQANSLIDQFWGYANFDRDELHLWVNFSAVKLRMKDDASLQFAQRLVQALPACTQQDLLKMGLLALQGALDQAPLCRPPDVLMSAALAIAQNTVSSSAGLIPEQVDLAVILRLPLGRAGDSAMQTRPLLQVYRGLRLVGPWLPLGSILCLVALVFWACQTAHGALFWSGVGVVLPGFITLLLAMLLALFNDQIARFWVQRIFLTDLAVFDVLVQVAQAVSQRYLLWLGAVSLVLTLAGAGLIVLAYFRAHKHAQSL